jgi:membrane protein implicated in regulation of membrane protease activity
MNTELHGLDPVTAAYFLAFVVGAGFSVLGFALGAAKRSAAHRMHHGHGGHQGHRGHRAHGGSSKLRSALADVGAWAAFFCVLGGTGYALRRAGWSGPGSFFAAALPALATGALLHAFGAFLARKSEYLSPLRLEGSLARVLHPITRFGTGEITVVVRGARKAFPARTTLDLRIRSGEEVVVVALEGGVCWVEPIDH